MLFPLSSSENLLFDIIFLEANDVVDICSFLKYSMLLVLLITDSRLKKKSQNLSKNFRFLKSFFSSMTR